MKTVVDEIARLRARADRYRNLARLVYDSVTNERILELTQELEQQASTMEKASEEQIRARAIKLWEQAGKPEGRDEEFWHKAEKELQVEAEVDPSHRTPDNL
jgi:Protein of unknown function (DUF2934)